MYQTQDKPYTIDYIVYNHVDRKTLTYLTYAPSRRNAEQQVRELERGSKITIIKIKSFENLMHAW